MAWSFTGQNNCCRVQCGEDADLSQEELEVMVQGMTREDFISEHLILPQGIMALCEDQNLRTAVLVSLPTLDDSGLAVRQTGGDPNCGIRIPSMSEGQS